MHLAQAVGPYHGPDHDVFEAYGILVPPAPPASEIWVPEPPPPIFPGPTVIHSFEDHGDMVYAVLQFHRNEVPFPSCMVRVCLRICIHVSLCLGMHGMLCEFMCMGHHYAMPSTTQVQE